MNKKLHKYGVVFIFLSVLSTAQSSSIACDANQGLILLNQINPPFKEIQELLNACDKTMPNDVQVLLLHGLVARTEGMKDNQYNSAISWLEKAKNVATHDNNIPALELAVTYEWSEQFAKAKLLYQHILSTTPDSRAAILGLARTETATNQLVEASAIYKKLLQTNPKDIEALNGMGRVLMVYKQYDSAVKYFNQVLTIQPNNADAHIGLKQTNALSQQHIQLDSVITPIFACDPQQGLKFINQKPPAVLSAQQILLNCKQKNDSSAQVLLLQGLTERAQKNYSQAIIWLKKAKSIATTNDPIPALELAVTYEWSHEWLTAKSIYNSLLINHPDLRPALLGIARIDVWQNNLAPAEKIYHTFLQKNPQDIDALNGLGRVKLSEEQYAQAKNYFAQVLQSQPENADAQLGLKQALAATKVPIPMMQHTPSAIRVSPCDTVQGLMLVNKKNPPIKAIQNILTYCDKFNAYDAQVFLLRGLLARSQKDYAQAIQWFLKAKNAAPANNPIPAQELALTYEWSLQLKDASLIYQELLRKNPNSRPALLGQARVETADYRIHLADLIYTHLLIKNPKDLDALNGMGRLKMTDKQLHEARYYFNQALGLDPGNKDSLQGLELLNNTTKYMLSFNQGQYRVLNEQSNSSVLYGTADLNATDRVIAMATHNSKQLQLDFTVQQAVLPNNSFFAGFQRQIPGKYGWGVSYDFRQHNDLPLETRLGATGNIFLLPQLQLFGGFWNGFPTPWNNQLYYSGLTYLTSLPFNISVTGFWGNQEIGGPTNTYAFDLSKEFANSAFYVVGTSYNSTEKFWGYHGRIIFPTFKNQAIEGAIEHYDFNAITIFSLGWRVYWA